MVKVKKSKLLAQERNKLEASLRWSARNEISGIVGQGLVDVGVESRPSENLTRPSNSTHVDDEGSGFEEEDQNVIIPSKPTGLCSLQ